MFTPDPAGRHQGLDGASGDLSWEYRRTLPEDVDEFFITVLAEINRNRTAFFAIATT